MFVLNIEGGGGGFLVFPLKELLSCMMGNVVSSVLIIMSRDISASADLILREFSFISLTNSPNK